MRGSGGREAPRKGANEIRNSARIDPTSCPLQLCAATQNMPPERGERRNQEGSRETRGPTDVGTLRALPHRIIPPLTAHDPRQTNTARNVFACTLRH